MTHRGPFQPQTFCDSVREDGDTSSLSHPHGHLQHMLGTLRPSSPAFKGTEPPQFPVHESITGVSLQTT